MVYLIFFNFKHIYKILYILFYINIYDLCVIMKNIAYFVGVKRDIVELFST